MPSRPAVRTIALAYSGGLDTSIIVPWLQRALSTRASSASPPTSARGRRAGGRAREGARLRRRGVLRRGPARGVRPRLHLPDAPRRRHLQPEVPARHLDGAAAHRQAPGRGRAPVGADALAHGCTGKGNDQVRFELTYATLRARAAGHRAVARVGHPQPRGRASTTRPAKGIPVAATKEKIYSRDAQPLAPLPRGRQPRGPATRAGRGHVHAHHRPGRRAGRAGGRRHRLRAGHARRR